MSILIGTSGWSYDHWHGVIYPNGIYPRERLPYYAQRFQTVELNSSSYYHWPRDSSFRSWRSRFPDGFCLSIKSRLKNFLEKLAPEQRVCLEFRHPSWHQDSVFELLEQHRTAYCVMSGAHLPCLLRATADFVYVRLLGPDTHHLNRGSYSDDDLGWWAERILEWNGQSRDVFVYFTNDGEGHALRNAETPKTLIGRDR